MKLTSLLSLGLFVFSINTYAAKVDITNPSPGDIDLNQTFVLNVTGAEFDPELRVVGGAFKISFDPTVLTLNSFSPDFSIWSTLFSGTDENSGEYFFSAFPTGPSTSSFNIGTLSFTAVGFGNTSVTLSAPSVFEWASAVTPNGVFPNAELIQYSSVDVSVPDATSPVPVPAAAWLFGTGLLAFGSSLRRNRLA